MNSTQFDDLVTSVRQAGEIRRGEREPARSFAFPPVDIPSIRRTLDLSQEEFALLIRVPLTTQRAWEQGRRSPMGPALALLRVAACDPQGVAKVLRAS